MSMNPEQFPTYKNLFPVLRNRTTSGELDAFFIKSGYSTINRLQFIQSLIIKERGHSVPKNTYRIIELVGVSTISWEDAAKNAMEVAVKSLEEMRVAEVVKLDLTIEDGKVATYRARVTTSFKYIDSWWILKDDDY